MNERENGRVVERFWREMDAADFDTATTLLDDEYICEWPQSRERIRGRRNFVAVNANYPGRWHIAVRRLLADGDQVATDVALTSDEGETVHAVSFFELRDGKILRETDYWPEASAAPANRAQWVETMETIQ